MSYRTIDKKFSTYTEAQAMVNGSGGSSGKTKFYGVAVGHVPGVYTDYPSVLAQTKGCVGAKQKGFTNRAEAQAYVDSFKRGASTPFSQRGDLSETSSLAAGRGSKSSDQPSKKQKKDNGLGSSNLTNGDTQYEPGYGPLPPGAEDNFDRNLKLDTETGNVRYKAEAERGTTKLQPTGDFSGPVVVYTDGSSLGNGKIGAVGGVGVYFGPSDPRFVEPVQHTPAAANMIRRNVSEPLRGKRQTNQRAELTAVARALDHIPIDRDALIITDSSYSIKCLTEWFLKWQVKGWKNSSGKDVENKDLIEPILARIREREMCKAKTKFEWIKGHANDPGNVAADNLAVQGSRNSTPQLRNQREISETLNGVRGQRTSSAKPSFDMKQEPDIAPETAEDIAAYEKIFEDLAAEQSAN